MARPSSAPEPSHPSGGMDLQSAGYTIVWDAYDQAVISPSTPTSSLVGSDLCHFADDVRPSPGAWLYLLRGSPTIQDVVLKVSDEPGRNPPPGKASICIPPGGAKLWAPEVYLSFEGTGGRTPLKGPITSNGTRASRTREISQITLTWSGPPARRTEVSTNVISRPPPSGGYARANGHQIRTR